VRPALEPFLDPRAVAVIGASRDPSKVGGSVLANLRAAGFPGRVVPVNAAASTVQGLPAAPSLLAIEGAIDLAVIAVPAPAVLPALRDCVSKAVPAAVVISAGFRESDGEGRAREAELRAWLPGQPLRVLGPNCLGWIRPRKRLNATFAPGMPEPGGIAFISHSGALAVAILDWSRARRMGFSLFASLGNQADLTETEILAAVAEDPETRVIVAYLEGVADGRRFYETLRATTRLKPVVVVKTGRSPEGARAVSSHTGALAGSEQAFDAAVSQAGALAVRTIEELFDVARALDSQPLPRGRRLAVVTNGGGLGIVATDAAREAGLTVPAFDAPTRGRLGAVLPGLASVENPIDLVGDADAGRFSRALHALGPDAADAVLIPVTVPAMTDMVEVARAVASATRGWGIPIVSAFVGGTRVAAGAAAIEEAGIPCYPFPERAVAALAGMALLAERRRRRLAAMDLDLPVKPAPRALPRAAGGQLGLLDLEPILAAYGIRVAAGRQARTPDEAAAVAEQIGFPVALKLVSPDIVHKTEIGGVRLGLASAGDVSEAARLMLARVRVERAGVRVDGVLVQPMVEPGRELLLGGLQDAQFGPVVVVGFGGIYVEVLRDTAMRLAPVTPAEAVVMLGELRMAPLLRRVRGEPPVDEPALAETISAFSRLVAGAPDLAEVEINPLVVTAKGAIAVDARAKAAPSAPAAPRGV
jgi:acetyltransferase